MNKFASRLFYALIPVSLLFLAWGCGGGGGEENPFALQSEIVVGAAANPDALAFAPDGRLFYVEHWTGQIRIVTTDGQLQPEPFATIANNASMLNWGATGLALDPEFETNHYVYAFYTEIIDAGPPPGGRPTVIRFTDTGSTGVDPAIIVGDLPEANGESPFNANGSLHFGPDGLLYLTLGDTDRSAETGPQGKPLPQDLATAIGKMLRIQKDGPSPADNPFADGSGDPRIFAYGFRNSFNFAFHPATGKLYGSDNLGATCDKLLTVERGANYGWPQALESAGDCLAVEKPPIHLFAREGLNPGDFQSTVGIAGMEFISGDVYPTLGDSLLVCESASHLLRRLVLSGPNFDQVTADDVIAEDCGLDITVSPEGIVYYSNDREIRRLVPAAAGESGETEEPEESEGSGGESGQPSPTPPAP